MKKEYLCAGISIVFWGSTAAVSTLMMDALSSMAIVFYNSLVAALFLLGVLVATKRLPLLRTLRPRQLLQLSARNPLYALCFLIQRREAERLDHFAFLRVPPGREGAVCQILQAEPVPYLFLLALHTPEQHSLIRITREHFFVLSQGSSLRFFRGKGGDNQQYR